MRLHQVFVTIHLTITFEPGNPGVYPARAEGPAWTKAAVRTDRYGDPLPDGALARLGTIRFRHGFQVAAVAFSADAKTVYSAGLGRGICLWDAATGRERLTIGRYRQPPYDLRALALSPDGKTLAVADQVVHLYDAATGKEMRQLFGMQRCPSALAFSPDGKLLAVPASDRTIRLWAAGTPQILNTLTGHKGLIKALAFAPDSRLLASADEDGTVLLWDVASGKEMRRLAVRKHKVLAVAFCPDGTLLASGGQDGTVRLWQTATGQETRVLGRDLGQVGSLLFSSDGGRLLTGGSDRKVRVWDLAKARELRRWQTDGIGVAALALTRDGKTLATAAAGGSAVRLWDVASGREVGPVGGHRGTIDYLAFTPDGKGLVSHGRDRKSGLWDLTKGTAAWSFGGPANGGVLDPLALSPDGQMIATSGSDDFAIRLWDRPSGKELRPVGKHPQRLRFLAFAPNAKILASADWDGAVRLWDVTAGRELHRLAAHKGAVGRLAFSPNGKLLASAGLQDRAIALWDVATGKAIRHWDSQSSFGTGGLCFSPDSRMLATGTAMLAMGTLGGTARLWDVATGKELRRLGEKEGCYGAAFSPDGRLLATAGTEIDNSVRVWERATGGQVRHFPGHHSGILVVAFSPDGRVVASGGGDSTVLLWDVTGRLQDGRLQGEHLTIPMLEARWGQLASTDAARAHQALWDLAASPEDAVPFLKKALSPAAPVDAARVARLIADLDNDRFPVRDKATRDLEKLGEPALPALRKALSGRLTEEMRRRLDRLVAKQEGLVPGPERLRAIRAVAVLEHIGTPPARALLESLVQGAPGARLTEEARTALERLGRQLPAGP